MKNYSRQIFRFFGLLGFALAAFSFQAWAQQAAAPQRASFDVTNYQMDVALAPADNRLSATVDVTFTPLEDARTVSFELNGSLKIDSITRVSQTNGINSTQTAKVVPANKNPKTAAVSTASAAPIGAPQITFVQDQAGGSTDLGPSVRIDLGETVIKGTPVTLRFKYSGVLNSASGGPLLTKRLASVGANDGYLMYAARWFPFHEYAADMATADISLGLPAGFQIVGASDAPVSNVGASSFRNPA
jgi:hypothetical protein